MQSLSVTHILAMMLSFHACSTCGLPQSSGKQKPQISVGTNPGTMAALPQLHHRTMLPKALPQGGPQLTCSELPVFHPETRLPTTTKKTEIVSPRRLPMPPWFRKQKKYKQEPLMTMGQVVSNNGSNGKENRKPRWLERLQNISNIASLLCVLDCTILPAVTLLLPLLGVAASPAQMEWLHGIGHSVAMYFVLPVGGSAAAMNFVSHKKPLISLPALLGLVLVYLANAHGGPILSRLPHRFAHAVHCGSALHRVTNILGCALLLGSNYMSHRLGCAFRNGAKHGDGCGC